MKRILYIDNLRFFLIILVVLHHLAITYGGPGGWYYVENESDILSTMLYGMFLATNQSFFMGFFFLISAYFTAFSTERKSIIQFSLDRLKRLGIPLLVFYFIVSPVVNFILARWHHGEIITFPGFIRKYQGFGFGPMWFVEALLFFTFFYLVYRYLFHRKHTPLKEIAKMPSVFQIFFFAILLGIGSFVIRIWLPIGWEFEPLAFQFPFFLQYISMFTIGLIAYHKNWLESVTYKYGIRWFLFAQLCVFTLFPILFVLGGGSSGNLDPFMGGFCWQNLGYALWEQITGIAMILGLTGIFKYRLDGQGKFVRILSDSSYLVFILHPLVLVVLALSLRNWHLYPVLKFIALAPLALIACFLTAILVRRIPLVGRIV